MTEQEFGDYWTYLIDKKYQPGNASLSEDERVFYAANSFRGSVPRSGLIGYFDDTECAEIWDAQRALAQLGLTEALQLLEAALRVVLHNQPLPNTQEFIKLFDDALSEEEFERANEELDAQMQDLQEQLYLQDVPIYDALFRFADEKQLRAPQ